MTIDQFDQLSDEDQSDLCEFEGGHDILCFYFPVNALLALPHETRCLFRDLSQAEDERGGTTRMDARIVNKFFAELSLHEPEKLLAFKALSFDEQKACFNYLDRYEAAWYKGGKGDLKSEAIMPEKSCSLTMSGMR